jgi:four helix bundle protein
MADVFSFEKLEVWQLSRELVKVIYKVTSVFPEKEKYGITPQMNRAAISVCSNIAEGSSRTSGKDQAHFYQIAYGSLMELLCQAIVANDLKYIEAAQYDDVRTRIELISNKLNSLRSSRLARPNFNG